MADSRFFDKAGPFTLTELADIAGAEIRTGDGSESFDDVLPLQNAGATHVSFLENKLYIGAFETSQAGACVVSDAYAMRAPDTMSVLVCKDPYAAFARIAQAFYPKTCFLHAPNPGLHVASHIHETALLGDGCQVDAGAVIGANVSIGTGCSIGANSTIGDGVVLGDRCWVGPNVTLQFAVIGKACVIHPGARIGQDGFGFAPGVEHTKVPQLGIVRIGDHVDIGANACIDRGSGPDTVIGSGTKIDNLVQIAHSVEIGSGCFFPALCGISGSTKIGNYVMMGGATVMAGHLTIGDGARIAGRSTVMRDVAPGETVAGDPAFPVKEYWRQIATLRRLSKHKKET